MKTDDKLYKKIQQAAENVQQIYFPGMDKVWSRVEDKLDTNVLKKENTIWKKLTVAASLLVVGTIAYHFYSSKPEIIIPENSVVVTEMDTLKKLVPIIENQPQVVEVEKSNPIIKENISEIIEEKTKLKESAVAIQLSKEKNNVRTLDVKEIVVTKNSLYDGIQEESISTDFNANNQVLGFAPNAKGIKQAMQNNYTITETAAPIQATQAKKAAPLIVMDGEAKPNKKVEELKTEEIDSIVYLKEPLYIINGVEYSEQELFGPKPTSPYAPLNQQNIISTTVYQGTDATKLYGKKGEKGVIVITTKNGKPKE